MDVKNTSNISGENITSLQNIQARDITIVSGKETDPEIKKVKQEIAGQIANMIQLVSLQVKDSEIEESSEGSYSEIFDDIDFDDLLKAIEYENCVLFLGPDISVDENGESLHEKFFKSISNPKRKYIESEGFFMPGSETRLINVSKDYYSKDFPAQNKTGINLLKKLAQIPFRLIVSLAPDDSMQRIFQEYNMPHKEFSYTGVKHDETDDAGQVGEGDYTIIYNALGNAAENGRYIYSHKQLNEYIKSDEDVKFPLDVEVKIKKDETTHYLFLGFDFNKWHIRLLMFELNLLPEVESYAFDASKTGETNREFIKKQFNIDCIEANFNEFTETLLKKSKEAGLTRSLDKTFAEEILKDLEEIRIQTIDAGTLAELTELQNKAGQIKEKINQKS
jgi:hypothetical protein